MAYLLKMQAFLRCLWYFIDIYGQDIYRILRFTKLCRYVQRECRTADAIAR